MATQQNVQQQATGRPRSSSAAYAAAAAAQQDDDEEDGFVMTPIQRGEQCSVHRSKPLVARVFCEDAIGDGRKTHILCATCLKARDAKRMLTEAAGDAGYVCCPMQGCRHRIAMREVAAATRDHAPALAARITARLRQIRAAQKQEAEAEAARRAAAAAAAANPRQGTKRKPKGADDEMDRLEDEMVKKRKMIEEEEERKKKEEEEERREKERMEASMLDKECKICFDEITEGVGCTLCGNVIGCRTCMDECLLREAKCPYCRRDYTNIAEQVKRAEEMDG